MRCCRSEGLYNREDMGITIPLEIDDESNTSFHRQISSVFKVPNKKDLYIASADRWMPNAANLDYEEYAAAFESIFNPDFPTGTRGRIS